METRGRKRLMSKELAEEIVQCGESIADCARIYGISKSYAEKIIYGRTSFTKMKREPKKRMLSDEEVIAIRDDIRPHKEIADQYGCSLTMVSDIKNYVCYFDVQGPESRPSIKRGPNRKLSLEQVLTMKLAPKQKLHYWAALYDVSITTVFNALNGFSYPEVKEKLKEREKCPS